MTKLQKLIAESEQIYAAEALLDDDAPLPDGAAVSQPNRGRSVVYSVRLRPEQIEQIEALARRLDVPASTLVRGWVLAGLAGEQTDSVAAGLDRLEADVQRLRALAHGASRAG